MFCDAARITPNNEYLLLDAQPPIITPYTPNDTTPKMYNTPTLMSATCKSYTCPPTGICCPQGITAEPIQAVKRANEGPTINKNALELVGMISSFKNILAPSANGCSIPKGPARFGPTLSWKN